jgi:predicted nucleic acid-binding Zn ribbon protein
MPRTHDYDDDSDDDREVVPCRHCRAEIDEDAEQCPKCGMYVTDEDAPRERKSAAWVILMMLALAAALVWVLGG